MATTTRQHIEMTRLDSSGNINILYPKNTLHDVYTDSTSGITVEGKVMFYGTCSTAAEITDKTVNAVGFKLVAGAHVTVKFTNAITVANATLNVNSTGAKAIYYEGTTLKANVIRAGSSVEFVYDGIQYCALAGVNPAYVSNENTTKFYLLGTPENINGVPSAEYFDTGVYVSTTSGQIVATSFSGNGASLTNLNASNISSGILDKERLATSGATAGSYGPSSDEETTHGGNITVPSVTVDAYGRVTAVKNVTYTLPTLDSADTKVTNTLNTTTKAYVTGTTSNETNTGTQVFDTGVYLDTTEGRLTSSTFMTGTCYLGSSTSNYINDTNYTGTAAKVGTLSEWLVDSCASASANGVTTKALTANQGYVLQNQIDTVNSNLNNKYSANGGRIYGNVQIKPNGSSLEGGELHLSPAAENTSGTGVALDNYNGILRIFGVGSADGSKTGSGSIIEIQPYNKTINFDTGYVINGKVSMTELLYLDGVTSAIQTQLNAKAASNHTHSYAGLAANKFTGRQYVSMAFVPAANNYTSAHISVEATNANTTSNRASIGFHNAGVVAGNLYLDNDGNLKFINNGNAITKIMKSNHFTLSGTTLTITI